VTEWLTPEQVAELTGLTTQHLTKLRYQRKGFPFYKPTDRTVLYDRAEIDRHISATKVAVRTK